MNSLPASDDREHVMGPPDAAVALIEYGDFASLPCARAFRELGVLCDELAAVVRFEYRHFSLPQRHPQAVVAAEAAEAAGAQGKFWEMHATLFEHQDDLALPALMSHAAGLELDLERFARDLREHRFVPRIQRDFLNGVRDGVCATPTLFIAGLRYTGPVTYEVLASVVRDLAESDRAGARPGAQSAAASGAGAQAPPIP
jgi:protein-disulfide isomerase